MWLVASVFAGSAQYVRVVAQTAINGRKSLILKEKAKIHARAETGAVICENSAKNGDFCFRKLL